MGLTGKTNGMLTWIVGLVVLWSTTPVHPAPPEVPVERVTYVDVTGRVVDDATGAPQPGVTVSLLYEVAVTDGEGRFRFEKIPLTHLAQVSVRVRGKFGYIVGCMTLDVPARFYPVAASAGGRFAITLVDPALAQEVELRLAAVASERVGEICEACHRRNPCVETETFQRVAKTAADLRGIIVDEDKIEEYRQSLMASGVQEDAYRKIRYQDTHPDGANLEAVVGLADDGYKGRFTMPADLPLVDDKYITCDTCHTRHRPTAYPQFARLAFDDERSTLCYQCHR